MTEAAAAREILRRREARRRVLAFTKFTKPDYQTNWHHDVLCGYLDRFVAGDIKRLMIFMPPRHGKSELVSRRLPAFIFGQRPDANVIACSYSADLASRMNRDVQRIIDSDTYRRLFPESQLFGANVRTVATGSYLRNSDIFEIVGHNGSYRSAGVGGGITGMGFHFGIIDDPVKRRKEAESEAFRNSVWEWYGSDFYTRQEGNGGILITTTRWHEDDLAGRILKQAAADPNAEQWTVVSFPALFEPDIATPGDPRQDGEALWPGKFDVERLQKTRGVLGQYQFQSLYQQRPTAREGNRIKRAWLSKFVDAAPAEARRVRYWDKAGTDDGGKFTAGVLIAEHEKQFYVEHVVRGQWSALNRERVIRQTAEADRQRGAAVVAHWIEQEPGSGGKESAESTVRNLAGHTIHVDKVTGGKDERLDPFAVQCEAGNVFLVRGQWNEAYIDEMAAVPNGKYRDQADASAGAFNKLTEGGTDWNDVSGLGQVEEYESRWK